MRTIFFVSWYDFRACSSCWLIEASVCIPLARIATRVLVSLSGMKNVEATATELMVSAPRRMVTARGMLMRGSSDTGPSFRQRDGHRRAAHRAGGARRALREWSGDLGEGSSRLRAR